MIDIIATTTVSPGDLFGLVEFRWEFFLQILNTLVLFLFLRHFLFTPVTEFMNKRTAKIQETIAEAESKREEAAQLKATYEEKLANIRDEELDILKNARLSAEARTSNMVKSAEREIDDMKHKARNDIDMEREKSIASMKDEVANLALMAASRVIDKEIDRDKHVAIIDTIIERAGEASWHI